VKVSSGANIQAAANANPTGTTFCLAGSYTLSTSVVPKDGQSFVGPAKIRGTADVAFLLRADGAPMGSEDVTLRDLDIAGFALRGVACWRGFVGERLVIHDNGRNGIGCGLDGGSGITVRDSHIFSNGNPAETGAGAAGMKFARASGVLVEGNTIELNIGNGVWCDLDCGSFTVRGNTVHGNTRKGIFFEVSKGPAVIAANVVTSNNCAPLIWGDGKPECDLPDGTFGPQSAGSPGGGIAMNSSCPASGTCVIRDNVLGGNAVAGINFRDDARPAGSNAGVGYDQPFAILVEGNDLNGDRLLNCLLAGITCTGNV
jgi:parallel beta-helix repeat protein